MTSPRVTTSSRCAPGRARRRSTGRALLALAALALLAGACSGDGGGSATPGGRPDDTTAATVAGPGGGERPDDGGGGGDGGGNEDDDGVTPVADPVAPTAGRTPIESGPARRDLSPYEGLGTWVDVFDYVPAYVQVGTTPPVSPASMVDVAALGVDTLYLQAARDDPLSPGLLADDDLTPAMLVAAHEAGLRVVAWFLPHHADVDHDVRQVRALLDFEVDGHRFDGVAIDIEDTLRVPDHAERNRRLVRFSERIREIAGDDPLGAIVLPPVALEVINDQYWPQFPWRQLVDLYDVWLPMSYWTNRTAESGYRDGYTYTDENIRRMLANLGVDRVPLHPIGGIGDEATPDHYRSFVRAATEHGSIGWSIYDFVTQSSASWEHLRERP
jgi:hypothetical protein